MIVSEHLDWLTKQVICLEQNNIIVPIDLTYDSTSETVVQKINTVTTTVNAKEIVVFNMTDENAAVTQHFLKPGKGSYGLNKVAIVADDLLVITADTSGFVPYTGAINNVDLNNQTISNVASYNGVFLETGNTSLNIGVNGNDSVNSLFVGLSAGTNNIEPNTCGIGHASMVSNTGSGVTAVGGESAKNNSGGFGSFIGLQAGEDNTASNAVANGASAMRFNTGILSTGIGRSALENNSGDNATSTGGNSGRYNEGNNVVFNGAYSGQWNTGDDSVGSGINSIRYNFNDRTTGNGSNTLMYNQGLDNTAIGKDSNNQFLDDTANLKNVADATTDINLGTNEITITSHGFGSTGIKVNLKYSTTGDPIGTIGFWSNGDIKQFTIVDADTLLSTENLGVVGTDTHTFTPQFIYNNTTTLGANTQPTKSNQVVLGDSNVTEILVNDKTIEKVKDITFKLGGNLSWNTDEQTLNIDTGLGSVLQAGREETIWVYNGSGAQINNGTIVYPVGVFGGHPSIELAMADVHEGIERPIAMATMNIPDGTYGICTFRGAVNDINTIGLSAGQPIYLSDTVPGGLQIAKPSFPSYVMQVGGVQIVDALGSISINMRGSASDTLNNFWNGIIRETFSVAVTSDGVTSTADITAAGVQNFLTLYFSDGQTLFDVTTPVSVNLTSGTDTVPQLNYVFIPETTKVLTVNTTGWPAAEVIRIGTIVLQSAATTQTDGALKTHTWNDHLQSSTDNQGHISHIAERLRQEHAKWDSGTLGTATVAGSDVWVDVTAGNVYQLHKQTFNIFDSSTGGDIYIVNDFTTPYRITSNLNTVTADSTGTALSNRSFSVVLSGLVGTNKVFLTLPSGSYPKNDPDAAVNDASNFSNYKIDNLFKGDAFLIARFTFTLDAGGTTYVLYDTEDLRGFTPNLTAGGGAGGAASTRSFLTHNSGDLTLNATHTNALVYTSVSGSFNLNVPEDATYDFPLGTQVEVIVGGDNEIVFVGLGAVTLLQSVMPTITQSEKRTLTKVVANRWVLSY